MSAVDALAWKIMAERLRPFVSDPRRDRFHAGFIIGEAMSSSLKWDDDIEEWNSQCDLLDEYDRLMGVKDDRPSLRIAWDALEKEWVLCPLEAIVDEAALSMGVEE